MKEQHPPETLLGTRPDGGDSLDEVYGAETRELLLGRVQLMGWVLAAIFAAYSGLLILVHTSDRWEVAPIVVLCGAVAIASRIDGLARYGQVLAFVLIAAVMTFFVVNAWGEAALIDALDFSLLAVLSALLLPIRARVVLFVALGGYAAFVTMVLFGQRPSVPLLVMATFYFAACTLMAVSARTASNALRRRELRARLEVVYERERAERLLLNILPQSIASRLKRDESPIADAFAEATVLFADIVGFTELTERITPTRVVQLLDGLFSMFDGLTEKHGLEKIKTIGDAYMVAGGIPAARADHAEAVARMALDMRDGVAHYAERSGEPLCVRIGINSGPVVAGVIGTKKFIYDLWGDAVNTASRMESHGEAGKIQVSETTYQRLRDRFVLELRGTIQVKGKGEMRTYRLIAERN